MCRYWHDGVRLVTLMALQRHCRPHETRHRECDHADRILRRERRCAVHVAGEVQASVRFSSPLLSSYGGADVWGV